METKEIDKIKNKHYCANNKTVGEQFNDAISEAYSLGLKERSGYELYGYLFEGKFYGDLEMLRNKTMNESNKPLPLFVKIDSEERDKDIKEKAIEFGEFLLHGNWLQSSKKGIWYNVGVEIGKQQNLTTKELYNSPEFNEFITPKLDKNE